MLTDKIGDLITRIRNGQRANHNVVLVHTNKLNDSILNVLKEEGYISEFKRIDYKLTEVQLKYVDGEGAIREISRISKPGRRVYMSINDVKPVFNGLGVNVLSTSKGVMSDYEAIRHNVGGELLFKVY